MKMFIYLERKSNAPLLIRAKSLPCETNVPRSGTWVIREWNGSEWVISCFPEITLGTIKTLVFVGEVKLKKEPRTSQTGEEL